MLVRFGFTTVVRGNRGSEFLYVWSKKRAIDTYAYYFFLLIFKASTTTDLSRHYTFFFIKSAIHPLPRYVGGHYVRAVGRHRLFCQKKKYIYTQTFIRIKNKNTRSSLHSIH